MHTRTWTVQIQISEEDALTRARAVLSTEDTQGRIHGEGTARTHPSEPNIPEIGDEIAASRALSSLAHTLFDTAIDDMHAISPKA